MRNLGMHADIRRPPPEIGLRPSVDMESCGQSFRHELVMSDRNPLHGVEISPSRGIGEKTEVRRCNKRYADAPEVLYDSAPLTFAQRPPTFEGPIMMRAGQQERGFFGDAQGRTKGFSRRVTDMPIV